MPPEISCVGIVPTKPPNFFILEFLVVKSLMVPTKRKTTMHIQIYFLIVFSIVSVARCNVTYAVG